MRLSNDLREFLELLNSRGIDYVVVGAHSLAFHGRLRYTGDLDILIRSTTENAAKLIDLLNEFGFADSDFRMSDFTEPEQMIQLGGAPTRIDLPSSLSSVTDEEAFATRIFAELDSIPVFVLGKEALIRNKRAVGPSTGPSGCRNIERRMPQVRRRDSTSPFTFSFLDLPSGISSGFVSLEFFGLD